MKDYYYFLGLKSDASEEDIKKVYRKLSLKYHPDKNENDDFFSERFREVQEAYETLIDGDKREIYNQNFHSQQRTFRSSLPPSIKTFSSAKLHAAKGEEVTIKWNTTNADVVKVVPFGLEKPYGERTFKITEFKDGKFVMILHANNSLTRQTAVQGITISEVSGKERERFREDVELLFRNKKKPEHQKKSDYIIKIAIAIVLLALAAYFLMQNF